MVKMAAGLDKMRQKQICVSLSIAKIRRMLSLGFIRPMDMSRES